jgi:uncharacterized protein (TIGR03083 family)
VTTQISPSDMLQAAEHVNAVLRDKVDDDWTRPAGSLDWDVRSTVEHMASGISKYALYLSSRANRFVALRAAAPAEATSDDLRWALHSVSLSLAQTASGAAPGARGFHVDGMADAEGFLSMGCTEMLVHGADVAAGLGAEFDPDEDLCRRVANRLFPWAPQDTDGWATLLWATGRATLPGQPHVGDSWMWHPAPLAEWDGSIPEDVDARAWSLDPSTGRWQPLASPPAEAGDVRAG